MLNNTQNNTNLLNNYNYTYLILKRNNIKNKLNNI